jgi:AcrR family transcriptional regulator
LTIVKYLLDDRLRKFDHLSRLVTLGPSNTNDEAGQHDAGGIVVDRGRALTEVEERKRERIARRQIDKFAERRDQLAAAALQTLAELGFVNTSLRDIAQHSEFSHGVLHYYFADKSELITYCVRQYKAECVARYDVIVTTATGAEELRAGFGATMTGTLRDDVTMHRLWYDLRNQSLFEEKFRADVAEIDHSLERMIWRIVTRYAELSERDLAVTPAFAYALLDGVFQHALLRYLSGDPAAAQDLDEHVRRVLPSLLA